LLVPSWHPQQFNHNLLRPKLDQNKSHINNLHKIPCQNLVKTYRILSKNRDQFHPKKFYLSHSSKWMQNGYSLSHSSTFTWTTPGKERNLYGFIGVVQVNVFEWLKEKATCIHLPEWLKYIFLGVCVYKWFGLYCRFFWKCLISFFLLCKNHL
jgi:hypothetical protein